MRIEFNAINFLGTIKSYNFGENRITQYFDDDNYLTKIIEVDKFERDVDTKEFDRERNVTFHLHKDYTDSGYVETFKDKCQEYTRRVYTVVKGSMTHRIEEYVSKSSPQKNYVSEFIRDSSNKLVRIITNGKVINI